MREHLIKTSVSGRYLLHMPSRSGPAPLLVGFHGYGQTAEDEFDLLCSIPGTENWLCCSIEALHPVYTSKGDPGSSWMTSRDREQRIEENVAYVDAVIERIRALYYVTETLCFHGFSQGSGMACRAALLGTYPASGLMLIGGDIPPELPVSASIGRVHIARGSSDPLYLQEQLEQDCARLHEAALPFVSCNFTGLHGPNDEYLQSAGAFLEEVLRHPSL